MYTITDGADYDGADYDGSNDDSTEAAAINGEIDKISDENGVIITRVFSYSSFDFFVGVRLISNLIARALFNCGFGICIFMTSVLKTKCECYYLD